VIALETKKFPIYMKKFIKGEVNLKFRYTVPIPHVNFILFYTLDKSAPPPISCGGLEIL